MKILYIITIILSLCFFNSCNAQKGELNHQKIKEAILSEFKENHGNDVEFLLNYAEYVKKFDDVKFNQININKIGVHANEDKSEKVFFDVYWVGSFKKGTKLILEGNQHKVIVLLEQMEAEEYSKKFATQYVGYGQAMCKLNDFTMLGDSIAVCPVNEKNQVIGNGFSGSLKKLHDEGPYFLTFNKILLKP